MTFSAPPVAQVFAVVFLVAAQVAVAQPSGKICSGSCYAVSAPGATSDCENWSQGSTYQYPTDYNVLPKVAWYTCPQSGFRILLSNGIGDHEFTLNNPHTPCANLWYARLPLNATLSNTLTEPGDLGPVAFAVNGAPMYGPQDANNENAADPPASGRIQDGKYWWGHAGFDNDWHYHNPWVGNAVQPNSTQLVGYALDGFPLYGILADTSVLDACNGRMVNGQYQYHLRDKNQVNGSGPYCNGTSPAVLWNYVVGCFHGDLTKTLVTSQTDSQAQLPSDCVEDKATGLAMEALRGLFQRMH